jgi:phosphoserine phosphatase
MGKTLTIFDLDNTLIKGDSSTLWSRFMVREGWVNDPDYLAREAMLMDDYDRGEMNIADYVALIQAPLIGVAKRRWTRCWRAACATRLCRACIPGVGSDSDFTG